MIATPAPAAAVGAVEAVWSPLLGSNPGAPTQSPVSWMVLAAARRQFGRAKIAATPAISVSTGQMVASSVTAAAVTVTPPVISKIILGTPNASTGAVVGTVTATDPGKYALTYKATTSIKGTVSITRAGVFTYTPTATARHAAAKSGAATSAKADTVTVTVTNSKGAVATQAVTVTITPANAAPIAKTPTVGSPNATTGMVTGSVSATDANSDPLIYSGSTTTSKGTVSVTSAGAFTYTPTPVARHAAAKAGATTAAKTDAFSVTVTDGYGGSAAVPVTVTVSPSNTAPAGTVTVTKPDPVSGVAAGKVTAADADADTVTYTASRPASGAVVVNADGRFTYTPTTAARTSARSSTTTKTDTFTITITDGYGGTKAVTVTPTIAPSNAAPVAGTATSTTNATTGVVTGNVNATDPDRDALTYTAATTTTAKGSVSVTAAGAFTYTPNAIARHAAARNGAAAGDKTDTFSVAVTDKYGAATTIPVNVTISPANANPVAGTPVVGTPNATTGEVTGSVRATDANNDALTYSGSTATSKGSVTVASNGTFTYTPTVSARKQAAANTTDTFTVTANDGYGGTAAINVVVPVDPGTPVAGTATVGSPSSTSGVVTGGAVFTDTAGRTLSYIAPTASTGGGTVTVNAATGAYTYTPTTTQRQTATATTTDTFTVTANNGVRSATETITVPVSASTFIAPAIQIDSVEPLSGTVKLSLSGSVSGAVTWYADLKLIGAANSADGYSVSWPTGNISNGDHQILALIQTGPDTVQQVQRTVAVSNSTVITLIAAASGTTGLINVDVRAWPTLGIQSVTAQFDGNPFGTLTAPNARSVYYASTNDVYRFTVNAIDVGSGSHQMVITATYGASSKTVTVSVPVNNPPVLMLSSPGDGAIVFGSVRITGTVASDMTGAITTTARLGDVPIYTTQGGTFDTTYNLTGVAPGTYTLTVASSDSSGPSTEVAHGVVVASQPALAYTPVFTLPAGASLITADASHLLYHTGGGILLRNLTDGSEISLAGSTTLQDLTDWATTAADISAGRVYVQAKGGDCASYACVYEFSAAGSRTNLSANSALPASFYVEPVVKDGYVIWTNQEIDKPGSYTLYNIASQTYTRIAPPASVKYVGNWAYDFAAVEGVVDFWYWGQTGGDGMSSTFDIFNWRSDTGKTTRVTSDGVRNVYPQVDQTRVAWEQTPVGGSADGTFALLSRSGQASSTQTLGTRVKSF